MTSDAVTIQVPRSASPSQIAWFVPRPIEGSGGHRTILQNVEALERAGHTCTLFVEDPGPRAGEAPAPPERRLAEAREQFGRFFGFESERIRLGFQPEGVIDLAIATAWYTAAPVARLGIPCKKAYFVQDYEAYFMPVCDGYLRAEDSYRLGLPAVTIGKWLTQRLARETGTHATFFDFCADAGAYAPDPTVVRERAVCAIYQPEKPRRCPGLVAQALGCLKHFRPDVQVHLYGTHEKPALWFEHHHHGLLSVEECARLYNRCTVGLCISATNPSRIPFEMMACGLPVVDVHRPNNLYDMPEQGVMLAAPRAEELARAMIAILDGKELAPSMSRFAREFMRARPLETGYAQLVAAVDDVLAGRTAHWNARALTTEPMYRRSQVLPLTVDPLSGKPAVPGVSPTQAAGVDRTVRERLAAMQELDRILLSRSWKTVESLKGTTLYRAIANRRFGPGWGRIDPKEDPRAVLERVRNSRSYRLIARAKSNPIARLYVRARHGRKAGDPFTTRGEA